MFYQSQRTEHYWSQTCCYLHFIGCLESYIDSSQLERCLECFKLIFCASEEHKRPEVAWTRRDARSYTAPTAGDELQFYSGGGQQEEREARRGSDISKQWCQVRSRRVEVDTSCQRLVLTLSYITYLHNFLAVLSATVPWFTELPSHFLCGAQCQSQADVAKILQVVAGPDTAARNCRALYVRPQHFMQQHAKMFNDLQNEWDDGEKEKMFVQVWISIARLKSMNLTCSW